MRARAIETRFDGRRFRSRLEARWAVVWAAMGLTYEYEPEGFDLGAAGRYLPDFYIRDWRCYVEIKPAVMEEPGGESPWDGKPAALAHALGEMVIALVGLPDPRDFGAMVFTPNEAPYIKACRIGHCLVCGELCLRQQPEAGSTFSESLAVWQRPLAAGASCAHDGGVALDWGEWGEALLAGLQARFEHGERGR